MTFHLDKLSLYLKRNIPLPSHFSKNEENLFNLGIISGLLFYEYIKFILEEANKLKLQRVYYFTREGEFFKKIHEQILRYRKSETLVIPYLLESSRLTTFVASLSDISLASMMRLWSMYRSQSVSTMCKSLNINEIEILKDICYKHELDFNEKIDSPWLDQRIIKLFDCSDFKDILHEHIIKKRNLLIKYLEEQDINNSTEKIITSDIGWKGSTQDNLSLIFKNTQFHAYYFGLQPFLNIQPNNILKKSFLRSKITKNISEEQALLKFVSPIEMICNSPNGTVIDYQEKEDSIIPIKKIIDSENYVYERYTQYFQMGVLEAIPYLVQFENQNSSYSQQLYLSCFRIAEKLWMNPPKILAEAYFNLHHDETFGLGEIINKEIKLSIPLLFSCIFQRNFLNNIASFLWSSGWAQGLFSYYNLSILNKLYNLRVFKKSESYSAKVISQDDRF